MLLKVQWVDKMEEKHKSIGIMGLIALRKSEAYYKVTSELYKEKELSNRDKEKIKKHIAGMKNEKFLSKDEKENKKIKPKLKLKDIDFDIKKAIKEIKL